MKKIVVGKISGLFIVLLMIATVFPVNGRGIHETIFQEAFIDPEWSWAGGGGGDSIDYGYDVVADDDGNCYITGKFDGEAVFGGILLTSYGGWDIFVAKLDKEGVWQWVVNAGGGGQDGGASIAVDDEGNSYITGVFYDVAWFGNTSLTSIGGPADPDVFVTKIDTNGNWQWAVRGGGYVGDAGYGIAVDEEGNSYVTGHFMWSATFGLTQLTSQGSADVFVAMLDTNGVWGWAVSGGGSQPDYVCDITVGDDGDLYLTGDFEGSATFGTDTLTSLGNVDVFIAKLDTAGNWMWARSGGSLSIERGYDIAVDSNNNVYVTGVFLASITFGTTTLFGMGSWDVYVVKIDSDGTWQWAVSVGSSATEGAWGIAVDHNDHPFICGVFGGVVTIGESTIISLDSHDVFVATLDDTGTWQWAMSAGGTNWDEGYALTSDKNGSIYVTGYFDGSAFFGNITLFTQGNYDVFIAKLTYLTGNEPPVADFNYSPRTPRVGQPVTFDASYSFDPDGDIISYEWDFGDETAGNGMIIDHVYSWSGSFSVSLKVTDRENAVDTLVKTIEVFAASEDFNFSITGGLGVSAIITNPGTEDARDVPWLIHVEGGILGLVNKVAEGTIDIIPAGQSTSVKTGVFLGFGPILITVRVGASEKTAEGKQVIIFSKVNDEQFLHFFA
ncbi:MAG: PKD domain-containing protein [Candidatus Thermoplasmatota archaeon]|jgi:hypothetical protein|nr:PKD domain-containing protein [Candidatus Thermoplasmatota archaeon]